MRRQQVKICGNLQMGNNKQNWTAVELRYISKVGLFALPLGVMAGSIGTMIAFLIGAAIIYVVAA